MGIDKIAKVLKSCNKKKGKNLTLSVVIGFLLSCITIMGADLTLDEIFKNGNIIKENNGKIIEIEYNKPDNKITVTYNNTSTQEINLSLLNEKAYNLLLNGLNNLETDEIKGTQNITDFALNNRTIFADEFEIENFGFIGAVGQKINNRAIGINNRNIFSNSSSQYSLGQYIFDNGLGINNGNIFTNTNADSKITYGQYIDTGLGINNGNIFTSYNFKSRGQYIYHAIGINNGYVSANGNSDAYGQYIQSGLEINNGVINSNGVGQYVYRDSIGINNGIIIDDTAYDKNVSTLGTFYKNGIALKIDETNGNKLVLNGEFGAVGSNNENLKNGNGDYENTSSDKNIFVNNLEGENNSLNLISNNYNEIHITTAVSKESNFAESGTVVTTENNFSKLDKSTIVGYFEQNGTLVDMTNSTNINLDNSVISAFGKDKDTKVTAVKFGAGDKIVTLNNSVINGKIDFSAGGNNTLNLNGKNNGKEVDTYKDGTQYGTYVSDVKFGAGNDEIHIKFGETGNENYSSSYDKTGLITLGNVNFGAGDDSLTFNFEEMKKGNFVLAGTIDFGKEERENKNDKIVFSDKLNMETDTEKNLTLLNTLLESTENLDTLQLADDNNYFAIDVINYNGELLSITDKFTGTIKGGAKDDTFVVNEKLAIEIDGRDGTDTLTLGTENQTARANTPFNLTGNILNFEKVDVNKDVRLDSNLVFKNDVPDTITTISVNKGNIILGVDYTQTENGKVIGHALYNKENQNIKFENTDTLKIDTVNLTDGQEITINHGDYDIESTFANLGVTTGIHQITYNLNGDILINLEKDIPIIDEGMKDFAPIYNSLNKIYHSVISADKLGFMKDTYRTDDGKTDEQAIKGLLEYYGKIYHSTPYTYSNEVSKKSAELITDSLLENKTMPNLNKWIFGGNIAGREIDSDANYYGQNFHKVDIGKNEVSAESNIYGAYAFGEYGISENQAFGFAVAGTKGDTDISGGSKLENNAVFVSAYAKQNINNLSLMTGLGYQHSFYDSTRIASNDYQITKIDEKYEDDLFTIFAGARYSYEIGNNIFIEPNAKLNLSHVMQDDINEGDSSKDITIEVDKEEFTSLDTEIGLDIVKKFDTEKRNLNLKTGISLVYAVDGYQDEFLNAKIVGATESFEIISPENDRTRMKFNLGAEYELENGMIYNLHGNYITSSDDRDYSVSFGVGYKF